MYPAYRLRLTQREAAAGADLSFSECFRRTYRGEVFIPQVRSLNPADIQQVAPTAFAMVRQVGAHG